jgi:hypothetical protein
MDKVKVFLGYLGKYHFWVLCGLAVLLGTFGWMKARGSLSAEFETNKSTVTGKFDSLSTIQSSPNPPNDEWTEAISGLTKQEQKEVEATWNAVYDEQKKVLAWPEVMGGEFKGWMTTQPATADIPELYRSNYRTEVLRTEFPKLAEIVQAAPLGADARSAAPTPDAAGKPATPDASSGTAAAAPWPVRVRWENQDAVEKSLQFEGNGVPTSLEVRLRQEDYWVYQALLSIIRKTNDGAPHVPFIKVIEDLRIGAKAADLYTKGMQPGHIDKIAAAGGDGGDGGGAPAEVVMDTSEGGPAPPPDQGRYLQKDGTALPAGSAQNEQFKRLPVYLKLVMDQREINRLLTECANYPLPVEVRQLRMTSGAAAASSAGRPGGNAQSPAAPKPGEAYDVTVEISGIIYLFNPPAKLGSSAGETQAAG